MFMPVISSPFVRIGAQAPWAGKLRSTAIFASLAALALLLSGCRHTPPEQALRDTIAAMQKAGEEHRVSDLMASVADDFVGQEGMDQKQLRQYLTVIGLQNRQLGTTLGPLAVTITGDRARVNFTLGASGGAGGWMPDRAQVYDVDTGWRMEGSDWKLISASWKPKL
jgi:hypothetical protein